MKSSLLDGMVSTKALELLNPKFGDVSVRFAAASIFIFIIVAMGRLGADVPRPSALPDAVDYALNCFAEAQKDRKLVLAAKIVDVDSCTRIQKLGFLFDLYDEVDIVSGRKLITGLVATFLDAITRNEKLVPYLACNFAEKNIVMRVRLRDARCGYVYPRLGNIAFISFVDGMVVYDTINSYTYDLDTWRMESYEDAVRLASHQ